MTVNGESTSPREIDAGLAAAALAVFAHRHEVVHLLYAATDEPDALARISALLHVDEPTLARVLAQPFRWLLPEFRTELESIATTSTSAPAAPEHPAPTASSGAPVFTDAPAPTLPSAAGTAGVVAADALAPDGLAPLTGVSVDAGGFEPAAPAGGSPGGPGMSQAMITDGPQPVHPTAAMATYPGSLPLAHTFAPAAGERVDAPPFAE